MFFSEDKLSYLAKNDPEELIKILNGGNLSVSELTFGAEILGSEVGDEKLALPTLKRMMKHINAVVREGAIMGIASFFYGKNFPADIYDMLIAMSKNDPSPGIKDYCKGLIEEHNEVIGM